MGPRWRERVGDPELDLMYWAPANPHPTSTEASARATTSTRALCWPWIPTMVRCAGTTSGPPHELWDYDGNNEHIPFDLDGRKLLAHFDKNGHLYILDRTNGQLVRVVPFAERLDWGDIDPTTGKVTPKKIPTREGEHICPGPAGDKEWTHAAYSPKTRLLYAPIIESCSHLRVEPVEFKEGLPYYGGEADTYPDHYG